MSHIKSYRSCFVPYCKNSTIKTPKKLFLSVPHCLERRKEWFKAVYRVNYNFKSNYFCCEDHFDLKADMKNYTSYKMGFSQRMLLKEGALPKVAPFTHPPSHKLKNTTPSLDKCYVSFCNSKQGDFAKSKNVTFHKFPAELYRRNAWLHALGISKTRLPALAVVCSRHFLNSELYRKQDGSVDVNTHGIPSPVLFCMICLDTNSKMVSVEENKLGEAYKNLTGQAIWKEGYNKHTLCVECAHRLHSFNRFRSKSLKAMVLMMGLYRSQGLITGYSMSSIDRSSNHLLSNLQKTTFKPDYCDLYIEEDSHDSEIVDQNQCNQIKTETELAETQKDNEMEISKNVCENSQPIGVKEEQNDDYFETDETSWRELGKTKLDKNDGDGVPGHDEAIASKNELNSVIEFDVAVSIEHNGTDPNSEIKVEKVEPRHIDNNNDFIHNDDCLPKNVLEFERRPSEEAVSKILMTQSERLAAQKTNEQKPVKIESPDCDDDSNIDNIYGEQVLESHKLYNKPSVSDNTTVFHEDTIFNIRQALPRLNDVENTDSESVNNNTGSQYDVKPFEFVAANVNGV